MKLRKSKKILTFVLLICTITSILTGCSNPSKSKNIPKKKEESLVEKCTKLGSKVPSFKSKDLNGKTVTNKIFTKKDLTVVNIWGTFCNPCIGEMPELGKWSKSMPNNVQIVGLITDLDNNDDNNAKDLKIARKIISKSKANFTQIVANNDFKDLLSGVVAFPTTFFVDKKGNIIGKPIMGANVNSYKKFVKEYLNEK